MHRAGAGPGRRLIRSRDFEAADGQPLAGTQGDVDPNRPLTRESCSVHLDDRLAERRASADHVDRTRAAKPLTVAAIPVNDERRGPAHCIRDLERDRLVDIECVLVVDVYSERGARYALASRDGLQSSWHSIGLEAEFGVAQAVDVGYVRNSHRKTLHITRFCAVRCKSDWNRQTHDADNTGRPSETPHVRAEALYAVFDLSGFSRKLTVV